MNAFQDSWFNASHESKPSMSHLYVDYSKAASSPTAPSSIPMPHEDFDPYLKDYNQIDDILSEALTCLQDLDIPVGEEKKSNHQHHPSQRGHKRQPSGTAIFGFVNHNKTLSINGSTNYDNKSMAPNQIFRETEQQSQQPQQPILFQTPQELELAQKGYYSQGTSSGIPPPPPAAPRQQNVRPVSRKPSQTKKEEPLMTKRASEDYIVPTKTAEKFKFPSSPPAQQTSQKPHQQQMLQQVQTVQVPVQYLQQLTTMIKNSEDVDMQKFLNYEFNGLRDAGFLQPPPQHSQSYANLQHMPMQHAPYPSNQQPQLAFQLAPPPYLAPRSKETTPELQIMASPTKVYPQTEPPRAQSMIALHHRSNHISPPPAVGLGLHYEATHLPPQKHDSSESEFSPGPKTPSPTLKSQAKFEGSPMKNFNWTPVIVGDRTTPMSSRKTHDKVSTLPPGEIDHYIIGPREDKTFVCNYDGCGKLFTRRYNVRSHVQTHLSDRPFRCDAPGCSKAFVRQHDLTRHKKIHEEFAFKCDCGKRFSRQDALFRHRQRQICSGGLTKEEIAKFNSSIAASSVTKSPNKSPKKSPKKLQQKQPLRRIDNDRVSKRLEDDLLKLTSKKSNQNIKSELDSPEDEDNVFLTDNYLDQFGDFI